MNEKNVFGIVMLLIAVIGIAFVFPSTNPGKKIVVIAISIILFLIYFYAETKGFGRK